MALTPQFFSMNRSTDVCSIAVWVALFLAAYGEITSSGSRWLGPQRSA